jgi:hypothetical protein
MRGSLAASRERRGRGLVSASPGPRKVGSTYASIMPVRTAMRVSSTALLQPSLV